jgi:hypothetical protein
MWLLFRDDDFGWQPKAFARLLTLFARYDQKLNAAAIPVGLTEALIQESIPYSYQAAPYLQLVTHGYRHENLQTQGKKSEFGDQRKSSEVLRELVQGREQLQSTFENYFPCFVPPWNRIHDAHLPLLKEAGYLMLSRDESSEKRNSAPIPEFNVSIDLHTNKTKKFESKELFRLLANKFEAGEEFTGVMLHHNVMTDEDFQTLEELLKELTKRNIFSCFYSDLIPGFERRVESEVGHV